MLLNSAHVFQIFTPFWEMTALSFEPSLALFLSGLHSPSQGESMRLNTLKIDVTLVVVTLKGCPKVHLPIFNYIEVIHSTLKAFVASTGSHTYFYWPFQPSL